MLLANIGVAQKLSKSFPDISLLRKHQSPRPQKFEEFTDFCNAFGDVEISDPNTLTQILTVLKSKCKTQNEYLAIEIVCQRTMQTAEYFCSGGLPAPEWRHFALNVDHYTHFTSPIRRYVDLVVHRLLDAALTIDRARESDMMESVRPLMEKLPSVSVMNAIAGHCNTMRMRARRAQQSCDLVYLCLLLKSKPLVEEAIVLRVQERRFFVLIPSIKIERKIYFEDLKLGSCCVGTNKAVLTWKSGATLEIVPLAVVQVRAVTSTSFPMEVELEVMEPAINMV